MCIYVCNIAVLLQPSCLDIISKLSSINVFAFIILTIILILSVMIFITLPNTIIIVFPSIKPSALY